LSIVRLFDELIVTRYPFSVYTNNYGKSPIVALAARFNKSQRQYYSLQQSTHIIALFCTS
jgi:hypothetical protein